MAQTCYCTKAHISEQLTRSCHKFSECIYFPPKNEQALSWNSKFLRVFSQWSIILWMLYVYQVACMGVGSLKVQLKDSIIFYKFIVVDAIGQSTYYKQLNS